MIDYKKSGVDIQAGDDLVSWLQNPPNSAHASGPAALFEQHSDIPDYKKRVLSGIGGFAALFDGRFADMKKPTLVSCTDGVGTKVKVASYFNDYSTIGQDLVAMCANDLICTGGTPLFFLDYYAVGKLNLESAQQFLTGVRKACEQSHMVLIGGETAEMPGVYQAGDFDCAGFSVGVVDQDKILGPDRVRAGDMVIGLNSSGFHSNGYSLLRQVFDGEFDRFRKWLLEPTRLYVDAVLMLKKSVNLHAVAHITGGGIENLPRVLPEHLKAVIKKWDLPECYQEVQRRSGLSDEQMRSTFNCGIGLIVIVPQEAAEEVCSRVATIGHTAQILGTINERSNEEPHVQWK